MNYHESYLFEWISRVTVWAGAGVVAGYVET